MSENVTGLFGKIPAHGDFVMRDLPSTFVNSWDEWLQHYIAGSKEQLAESWLNVYLVSPIWRFVFSDGVLDNNNWVGVMLPSVDRVGRYYPLSAIRMLPESCNPLDIISTHTSWYDSVEDLMLKSLDGEMSIDDLSSEINMLEFDDSTLYEESSGNSTAMNMQINMEFEEQSPTSTYPYIFNSILRNNYASYGVWTTRGSELVEPCLFLTQGMPDVGGLTAMLDGQWNGRGWNQPYTINNAAIPEPA